MDEKVEEVLDLFRRILRADGGVLELVDVEGSAARIRYLQGHNQECPECVLAPESLEAMIKESMQVHAPHISEVKLV